MSTRPKPTEAYVDGTMSDHPGFDDLAPDYRLYEGAIEPDDVHKIPLPMLIHISDSLPSGLGEPSDQFNRVEIDDRDRIASLIIAESELWRLLTGAMNTWGVPGESPASTPIMIKRWRDLVGTVDPDLRSTFESMDSKENNREDTRRTGLLNTLCTLDVTEQLLAQDDDVSTQIEINLPEGTRVLDTGKVVCLTAVRDTDTPESVQQRQYNIARRAIHAIHGDANPIAQASLILESINRQ